MAAALEATIHLAFPQMSYIFFVGDEEVWSPALQIGKFFMNMAETLAANENLDLEAAGSGMCANDFWSIDPPALALFVQRLLASSVVANRMYRELTRGFLGVCLVMLDRAGVPFEPADEVQRELLDLRDALAGPVM
ncbi:DUF6086 family protein [Amycolatopsis sp. CA-161197]|uniref:DUF6086 family protein n=1 Tax=Amycolatopsis sp. CA-161197 TaxID=3239922 RepID=UPI003D8FB2F3